LNNNNYDLQRGAPPLDFATVAWLDRVYPNHMPTINMSEREIWMKIGQRQVVEQLKNILTKQSQEAVSGFGPRTGNIKEAVSGVSHEQGV